MFNEFGDYIIQGVISLITGGAGYFLGKKRADAELDSVNWANFKTMQEAYNQMAEDATEKYAESKLEMLELKQALKESKKDFTDVSKENSSLRDQIIILRQTVKDLSAETLLLTKTVKDISSHVDRLEKELDDCRKGVLKQ